MQQESEIQLVCPEHQEKIIQIQQSEAGQTTMYCVKCLTQSQMSIEVLTQLLRLLREKEKSYLKDSSKILQQNLTMLKELLIRKKNQHNQQMNDLIEMIVNIQNDISQKTQQLDQSLSNLQITEIRQRINDLVNQSKTKEYLKTVQKIKDNVNQKLSELINSLLDEIKSEQIQKKENNSIPKKKENNQREQVLVSHKKQYQEFSKQTRIWACLTMDMQQDQNILINGQLNNIQIYHFYSNGQLIPYQMITQAHPRAVTCLCMSHKDNWFFSGSSDSTIKLWKRENNQWSCQDILEGHNHYIKEIILNKGDDLMISSSEDQTVKIWNYMDNINKWQNIQTLMEHTSYVYSLSLSSTSNLLATCAFDGIRIWYKESDQVWKLKQLIDNPCDDFFLRLYLIDNNELIASSKQEGRLIRYINNKNMFEIKSELTLNKLVQQDSNGFPIIYNHQLGLVLLKHGQEQTYILRKQENGEFIIEQIFKGHYGSGCLSKDGKFCILNEFDKQQHLVLKSQ